MTRLPFLLTCTDENDFLGFLDGHASDAEAEVFEEHLASCSDCQALVAELGKSLDGPAAHWHARSGGDVVGPGSLNVHIDVAARTADLEGLRRAALAAAELRSNGVPSDEVGPALVTMEQRNPYTGEPLTWQPDSREIVFQGILRGYRGRHALWY